MNELLIIAVVIGLGASLVDYLRKRRAPSTEGWVYFIAGEEGPVKIGQSKYEPAAGRLGDIQNMSPFRLRVLFKAEVKDRIQAERALHDELAEHRIHHEWFDRDAALALIDHLKGA